MAALDFPASPTDGQVYQNWIYSTSKGAWQAKPMVSAKTVTADVAPSNPANGDEWLNTLDGCLYIYYVDVDGGQWVQVKNDASFSSELGPTVDALNAGGNVNYIMNADFSINQRAFTTSSNVTGVYTFDRWRTTLNGATVTASAQTFASTDTLATTYGARNYIRTVVSGQSDAVNNYARLTQAIENVSTLAGKTVTLSFWARAASGAPKIALNIENNYNSTTWLRASAKTVTISTSWERYSVTIAVPSVSGYSLDASNITSSLVEFWFSAGSAHSGYTNTLGLQANTFDIWGVQLQDGTKATAFHRSEPTLQAELAACQRYYLKVIDSFAGATRNTIDMYTPNWRYPVPMRAAPTLEAGATYRASTGNAGTVTPGGTAGESTIWGMYFYNGANNWTSNANIFITFGVSAEL